MDHELAINTRQSAILVTYTYENRWKDSKVVGRNQL